MKRKITIIFCIYLLLLFVGCEANEEDRTMENTTDYMVLLGEDSSIVEKVSDVDVLVIDAAYFCKEEIASLKDKNIGKVYTYLNIGSIENFRSFYEDYENYILGDYENWPEEKWIDVSQPEWQEFIINESKELAQKGIDGFFIDNVDVFYLYPNDEIYNGLVDILSGIKGMNKPVYLNGGDCFVRKYIESGDKRVIFDGVNQECVYTTYDFTNDRFLKNSEENMYYFTEYLDMLVENGYVVYVLEYATDSKIRSKSYFYSMEHNYICYVSDNIELLMNN